MGKKNKYAAKRSIKVLSDGRIKITKNKKIDLEPFITDSVSDHIIGTIDPSKKVNGKKNNHYDSVGITNFYTDPMECLRAMASASENTITVVNLVKEKDSKVFDLTENSFRGDILRSSILGASYKQVKSEWLNTLSQNSGRTNFMYFPRLVSFMNSETGDTLYMPFTFNYLLISIPSMNKIGYDKKSTNDVKAYLNNIVADIFDAIITVNAVDVVVNPYEFNKMGDENAAYAAELFNSICQSDKVKKSIRFISFVIPTESNFITFLSVQNKMLNDGFNDTYALFNRIDVGIKKNDREHIFNVEENDEDDDADDEIFETNVKKDGSLDIDSIVDKSEDF